MNAKSVAMFWWLMLNLIIKSWDDKWPWVWWSYIVSIWKKINNKMWLIRPILWDDHGELEVPHIHYIIYIFDKIYTLILIMVKTSYVLW